jgi:hypothetical protein
MRGRLLAFPILAADIALPEDCAGTARDRR